MSHWVQLTLGLGYGQNWDQLCTCPINQGNASYKVVLVLSFLVWYTFHNAIPLELQSPTERGPSLYHLYFLLQGSPYVISLFHPLRLVRGIEVLHKCVVFNLNILEGMIENIILIYAHISIVLHGNMWLFREKVWKNVCESVFCDPYWTTTLSSKL